MRDALLVLVLFAAASVAMPGAILAHEGLDMRSCYRFVDSIAPTSPDAPIAQLESIAATGTPLTLGDDALSAEIPLGFSFRFFGADYTSVRVSSNGFVTFVDGPSGCCNGRVLGDATPPNAMVAALWQDMNPTAGGTVHYQTLGTAPDRVFVVQFTGVHEFDTPSTSTFQTLLYETSDRIEVRYDTASSTEHDAVAGLEAPSGAIGLTWRMGQFALSQTAVRYEPQSGMFEDQDGDGVVDCVDTCRLLPNPEQTDGDYDGAGDPCDRDDATETQVATGYAYAVVSAGIDGEGNFVVAWDTDDGLVKGRWYDRDGATSGDGFTLDESGFDRGPDVGMREAGDFVVAWQSSGEPSHVLAATFAAGAQPTGVRDVDPTGPSAQVPSAAMLPGGEFVVVWDRSYGGEIAAQGFGADGQPLGSRLLLGTPPVSGVRTDVAAGPSSDFLTVWVGDGGGTSIVGRRATLAALQGDAFPIGAALTTAFDPQVAMAPDGTFVTTWSETTAYAATRPRLRRHPVGADPDPAFFLDQSGGAADVAMDGRGDFIVVWEHEDEQGGEGITAAASPPRSIVAQRFFADGRAQAPPFTVSPEAGNDSFDEGPAIATNASGRSVVAWIRDAAVWARRLDRCGDGNLDAGEECDDGGVGDECAPDCANPVCGDGRIDPGEQCDAGGSNGGPGACCTAECTPAVAGAACDDGSGCTGADVCTADATCAEGVQCSGIVVTPPKAGKKTIVVEVALSDTEGDGRASVEASLQQPVLGGGVRTITVAGGADGGPLSKTIRKRLKPKNGFRRVLKLKLNKTGRAILNADGRLGVNVVVSVTDRRGDTTRTSSLLQLLRRAR